ncbi:hypothetical protein Patl1_12648 [Pistacia atlantica]|uniref:Uncharacterized protein n=1 Tax=Pistacia atlantica TaxID=434234 RepID=A0ACC1AS32_9ROSI|nr:hypothetical protein Patl1_12648 [Pistacia atlantica]
MSILFTQMFSSLFGSREARILVLGLDNAGKTTILYRLQMGEAVSTIPSRWPDQYQAILEMLFPKYSWVMVRDWFVRLADLNRSFHSPDIVKGEVPSSDLPDALDAAAVSEALELPKMKNCQWAIFKSCAVKGEGLFEGLEW